MVESHGDHDSVHVPLETFQCTACAQHGRIRRARPTRARRQPLLQRHHQILSCQRAGGHCIAVGTLLRL